MPLRPRLLDFLATLLVSAALLLPVLADAAPPDRRVEVRAGGAVTERLAQTVRVHVEDADVAEAEQLPSHEIRIEGRAPGVTWLFLHGEEGLTVWQIRVSTPLDRRARDAALEAARAACPRLERTAEGVTVQVASAPCHAAVLALGPHLDAEALSVRFDADGLRAQIGAQEARLARIRPDLAARVQIAYLGVTLRLTGQVDSVADRDALLRLLWQASAGRLLLDLGRLEIAPEP
jgi:hypothetical protein